MLFRNRLIINIFIVMHLFSLASCALKPKGDFTATKVPKEPDYGALQYWAAHPDKKDLADKVPNGLRDEQATANVDVFFVHPTTYLDAPRKNRNWNADLADVSLNNSTDAGSIQFQGSIFNGCGRVYAPRYRQAHYQVFFPKKDTISARRALEVAYADIAAAFDYYLQHWNQGRPFILAGHSQGALHIMQILKKRVEGTPLEQQLVAAYIVGWPVRQNFFSQLKPCTTPEQTDCYCTWRTWEREYGRKKAFEAEVVCTNPLTWSIETGKYAPASLNLGGVVRPFETVRPEIVDAEVFKGILLAKKPKFPGSFFFRRKNYHIGDLNLYYMNVRENAQLRAAAFQRR
jgi:hypothetical protein